MDSGAARCRRHGAAARRATERRWGGTSEDMESGGAAAMEGRQRGSVQSREADGKEWPPGGTAGRPAGHNHRPSSRA